MQFTQVVVIKKVKQYETEYIEIKKILWIQHWIRLPMSQKAPSQEVGQLQ